MFSHSTLKYRRHPNTISHCNATSNEILSNELIYLHTAWLIHASRIAPIAFSLFRISRLFKRETCNAPVRWCYFTFKGKRKLQESLFYFTQHSHLRFLKGFICSEVGSVDFFLFEILTKVLNRTLRYFDSTIRRQFPTANKSKQAKKERNERPANVNCLKIS